MKTLQELKGECLVIPEQEKTWEDLYIEIVKILEIPEDFGKNFKYTESDLGDIPFEVVYIQDLVNTWIVSKYGLGEKEYCLKPIEILRSVNPQPLSYHGSLSDIYVYRWSLKIKDIPDTLSQKDGYWVWNNHKFLSEITEHHRIAIEELSKLNDLFPILN